MPPERLSRSLTAAAPAVLAAIAFLAQLPIHDRNFVPMDEGHLALTAARLLDGDLLYRDIHTGIFPGIYALTAALFAVFGEEVLVTRWAEVAVNVATVVLLWQIGLRIVPARWAALPPLGFVGLVWIGFPVLSMFNYASLSGLLALGALLAALRYLERGARGDGAMVGLLVGLCLFTKQNYGGLAAIAIALVVVSTRRGSALQDRSLVAAFRPIATSGAAFLAVAIGALAALGILGDWVDLTLFSLVGPQLESFDNPIPPILGAHPAGDVRFVYLYIPSALFDYLLRGDSFLGMRVEPGMVSTAIRLWYGLPLLALCAAPVVVAFAPRRADTHAPGHEGYARPDAAVVVFAIVFFFGIFPSAVFSHLVYVMAPVLLVFALLGARAEELARRVAGPAAGRAVFAAAAIAMAGALAGCATIPLHVRATYDRASMLPHVGIEVSPDQAEIHREALRFIDECAAPGEPIFALPILPVLYLASGHPNPVKWDLLIPGAIDEHAIVDALERERVRCVVRQRDMNPEFPPLEALYPELDGYIRLSYRRGRELRGGQQVWYGLRRSTPFRADEAASGR